MNKWKKFGIGFANIRKALGLSLTTVARDLGISLGRLQRFESEHQNVKEPRLISKAYENYLDRKIQEIETFRLKARLVELDGKLQLEVQERAAAQSQVKVLANSLHEIKQRQEPRPRLRQVI